MDTVSRVKRSAIMSAIKGRGNRSTEIKLVLIMHEYRITGWRRGSLLPGKPDFVFPAAKVAMFVDGCFWHSCPHHRRLPKTRVAFWHKKLRRNAERDREVRRAFQKRGWRVLRIWEHELAKKNEARLLRRIQNALTSP
jgi:DNA mismatch endonuclease (patch repair protein)